MSGQYEFRGKKESFLAMFANFPSLIILQEIPKDDLNLFSMLTIFWLDDRVIAIYIWPIVLLVINVQLSAFLQSMQHDLFT